MSKFSSLVKAYWQQFTRSENVTAVIKYHAVRRYKKVQRNEPCPCGSWMKYKNCCLKKKNESWKWDLIIFIRICLACIVLAGLLFLIARILSSN